MARRRFMSAEASARLIAEMEAIPEKIELIRSLGAAGGFNYRQEDCFTQLQDACGGIDVALEMVGGTVFRVRFGGLAHVDAVSPTDLTDQQALQPRCLGAHEAIHACGQQVLG